MIIGMHLYLLISLKSLHLAFTKMHRIALIRVLFKGDVIHNLEVKVALMPVL